MVVGAPMVARSHVLASLGLQTTPHQLGLGAFIRADATGLTDVPRVWVAGNVMDLSATLIGAAAQGVMAATAEALARAGRRLVNLSPAI
jgi:thioredoxin reductase